MNSQILDRVGSKESLDFLTGLILHPDARQMREGLSLLGFVKRNFTRTFKQLAMINFSIHVVPFLIFKLKKYRQTGIAVLIKNLLINFMKSVMFLTLFIVVSLSFLQIPSHLPALRYLS